MSEMRPGVLAEVAPGVRRILAPNPSIFTGPGTNTYLVGDRELAVIDPGPDDDGHLHALCTAVGDRLRHILVTHNHSDHAPLARRLKRETGATVLGFGPSPAVGSTVLDAFDPLFLPDRRLGDGDRIELPGATLAAVHTPGHASGHLCFQLAEADLLFSGDHVMSGSTVVIAPPDGDMADYMEALERVRDLRPARIAPGHGELIDDPQAVLDEYLVHRRQREAQVLAALTAAGNLGAATAELVSAIYVDVPASLHPVARYSVWAHLRKLAAEGTARAGAPDDPDGRWWIRRPDPLVGRAGPPPLRT